MDDHVVAQVVEAELVVGAVGDVGGVGLLAVTGRRLRQALVFGDSQSGSKRKALVVLDAADGQAEGVVDLAHPLGVALGQVVVDGNDVDARAGERR